MSYQALSLITLSQQIVISTARSDWEHDHTTDTSTLSYHLQTFLNAENGLPPPGVPPPESEGQKGHDKKGDGKKGKQEPAKVQPLPKTPGKVEIVLNQQGLPQGLSEYPDVPPTSQGALEAGKPSTQPPTGLFSSSLNSQSADCDKETVMIFPEWRVVCEVPNSDQGAQDLFAQLSVPSVGINNKRSELKSWTLPYRAVVLLCSHKRRDKRCHIAAPLLEKVSTLGSICQIAFHVFAHRDCFANPNLIATFC